MDEVYRGGWAGGGRVDVGDEWEAEGRQNHPQKGKQQCCVFSRAQKLPQSTRRKAYKDRLACSVTVRIPAKIVLSLKYLSIERVKPKKYMRCYVFLSDESLLT